MKKLIGILSVVLFSVVSIFAQEYRFLTSSGLDTIFAQAGAEVEETYFLSGGETYVNRCELQFDCGCFPNVLDNHIIVYPGGDLATVGKYNISGNIVSYDFDKPWSFRQLLTLKGIMKAAPSSPYDQGGGQISFMVRAKIFEEDGDTVIVEKKFTIRRVGEQSFDQIMGNGSNRIEYNGMKGYLIYSSAYTHGYFISDSTKFRYCLPWTGNGEWSSDTFTNAISASWGWDKVLAKKISNTEIRKYPLSANVLVKPGYCVFYQTASGKYYESTSFGVLKEVSKEKAELYGSDKIIPIPDSFIVNYTAATAIKFSAERGKQQNIFTKSAANTFVSFDLRGRKIVNRFNSVGLNIVRLQNGQNAKTMNLNRLIR